jgi:hypothetical protein
MDLKFYWIGWCTEGTSDKVWGYCGDASNPVSRDSFVFWGRRGRRLRFKSDNRASAHHTRSQKEDKGYIGVTEQQLKQHWPNFVDDLNSELCFSILANKVL